MLCSLINAVYSVGVQAAWFIINLFFTLVCLPLALRPARYRYKSILYFRLTTWWSYMILLVAGLRYKITGWQHVPKRGQKPVLFVMNHTSPLDGYFMEIIVGSYPHMWMSKQEYAKIPLFGWLVKRMHVLVNRNNPRQAMKSLLEMKELLETYGSHGLMFPEGTRYRDGKIHRFLPGFAHLAKKLDRPVIPVAVAGLHTLLPKGAWRIKRPVKPLSIVIGKPMTVNEGESPADFTQRVQAWFETTIADIAS